MPRKANARDLHVHAAELLAEVRKGREVIIQYRGKPFALLKPLQNTPVKPSFPEDDRFFGMWRDRKDMKSVRKWIDQIRAPRYPR